MKKFKYFMFQILMLITALISIEFVLRIINMDMKNYDIEMWKYANELKTYDPKLGHVHLSNKSSILQGVKIDLNSRGMRSKNFDLNENKIIFLGSSISLGWGIENQYTYPELIQSKLSTELINYKVLNSSVGNYNTYRYVNNYLTNHTDINPQILVVNYFINDVEDLHIREPNWLLKNSQLAATIVMTLQKLQLKNELDLNDYYQNLYNDKNPSFIKMKNSLVNLSKYAKEKNIPVLLTVIPDIHFLKNYPFENIHLIMKNISSELGFYFHDLYPVLKGISFNDLRIIEGDSHPNELGHEKIANDLYPKIKKLIKN